MSDSRYLFLWRGPEDEESIRSSLQSYETALLLIAIARLPAALTTLISAIESALKVWQLKEKGLSKRKVKQLEYKDLIRLFAEDYEETGKAFKDYLTGEGGTLGAARNKYAHQGAIPEDDPEARRLMAAVGFPYYEAVLSEIWDIDLRHCLRADINLRQTFDWTASALKTVRQLKDGVPTGKLSSSCDWAFIPLTILVRGILRFEPPWLYHIDFSGS